MTRAIYRYEVPVDDAWHRVDVSGPILHVDSRDVATVEVWAWHEGQSTAGRELRVFGTGQPIPEGAKYVGTAIPPGGHLVWHLMEQPEPT